MFCQHSVWHVFSDIYDYTTPISISVQSVRFRIPVNMQLRNWKCVIQFYFCDYYNIKHSCYMHFRSSIFFGRELMLRLPIMTLFIFSILVFLSTERQSVALWEFSHAPKIDFLGTLLSGFFEDRGDTSSIYVSTLTELALLACCQSNISFSELCKSTLKFISFSKLMFK